MLTTNAEVLDHLEPSLEADTTGPEPSGQWTEVVGSKPSEAVRYCHSLAVALNATAFSFMMCAAKGEARRLAPIFDSDFPNVSALSRSLASSNRNASVLNAAPSPAWWCPPGDPPFLSAPARRWAREIEGPTEEAGVAFPVSIERGRSGLVVFIGSEMAIDEIALCETHARCHAMFAGIVSHDAPFDGTVPSISKREIECLRLTANGMTSEEIATALGLSVHTANQYLTNSTHKLNAVNRIHAVAKALRSGLID